jgi:tRNA(fMet)-specific endonuclease VapC
MVTYLLDTSVIIDVLNDKKNRRQLLRELISQGNTLACCPINITEVYAGLRPKEEESTVRFLRTLQLYPMTWPVAEMAGLLKRDHAKKGQTLNLGDVIIAATALHNSLTLITDNTKDFPMQKLSLYTLPNHHVQ